MNIKALLESLFTKILLFTMLYMVSTTYITVIDAKQPDLPALLKVGNIGTITNKTDTNYVLSSNTDISLPKQGTLNFDQIQPNVTFSSLASWNQAQNRFEVQFRDSTKENKLYITFKPDPFPSLSLFGTVSALPFSGETLLGTAALEKAIEDKISSLLLTKLGKQIENTLNKSQWLGGCKLQKDELSRVLKEGGKDDSSIACLLCRGGNCVFPSDISTLPKQQADITAYYINEGKKNLTTSFAKQFLQKGKWLLNFSIESNKVTLDGIQVTLSATANYPLPIKAMWTPLRYYPPPSWKSVAPKIPLAMGAQTITATISADELTKSGITIISKQADAGEGQ